MFPCDRIEHAMLRLLRLRFCQVIRLYQYLFVSIVVSKVQMALKWLKILMHIYNKLLIVDIKRLNKIDKDNEIFAFKVLKVPLTAQNILLDTLPKVHKTSGQNSPTNKEKVSSNSADDASKEKLEEKLLVASVSNAVLTTSEDAADRSTNLGSSFEDITSEPLLDRTQFRGYIRTFGAPKSDYLSFNGSDCELNWVVLLLCILAVCLLVPLIYVYIAYEHPEEFSHSKYDDPDLKRLHHINILNATTRKP